MNSGNKRGGQNQVLRNRNWWKEKLLQITQRKGDTKNKKDCKPDILCNWAVSCLLEKHYGKALPSILYETSIIIFTEDNIKELYLEQHIMSPIQPVEEK